MSELIQNPLSGDWVIVAEERAARPQGIAEETCAALDHCPFCIGHEQETPPSLLTLPEGGRWQVRVVPNLFPALQSSPAAATNNRPPPGENELASSLPGVGAHEVVIESPDHRLRTAQFSLDELLTVFQAYRARVRTLSTQEAIRQVQVFKNVGGASGATLEHAHSQIVGLPLVTPRTAVRLERAKQYFTRHGGCLVCAMLERELAERVRLTATSAPSMPPSEMVAFCPAAARSPGETWIVPRRHAARFEEADDATLRHLAAAVHDACRRIDAVFGRPDYNLILQTSPCRGDSVDYYHWHWELIPRVTRLAGFEWSTGCYINPMKPERAAQALRAAAVKT